MTTFQRLEQENQKALKKMYKNLNFYTYTKITVCMIVSHYKHYQTLKEMNN